MGQCSGVDVLARSLSRSLSGKLPSARSGPVGRDALHYPECIRIADDGPTNLSGDYFLETGLRESAPCYSRRAGGALYFDGQYWKLISFGQGLREQGWTFAQEGINTTPPLGRWEESKNCPNTKGVRWSSIVLQGVSKVQEEAQSLVSAAPTILSNYEVPDKEMELTVSSLAGEILCTFLVNNQDMWQLRKHIEKHANISPYRQRLIAGVVELPLSRVPIRSQISGERADITLIKLADEQGSWIQKVVEIGPGQLQSAPDSIRADRAMIWVAALHDVRAVKHAAKELFADHEFAIALLQQNADVVRYAPAEVLTDNKFLELCAELRAAGKLGRPSDDLWGPMRKWTYGGAY